MDNLGSHKVAGVQEAIEAAGATQRFLPAYSPDLDPIEQVFAISHQTADFSAYASSNEWPALAVSFRPSSAAAIVAEIRSAAEASAASGTWA
jgi:transposase